MMKSRAPSRHSRTRLIEQLMAQPQLPAYVEALSTPVFSRLVQHIGKEDAQGLLILATDAQVRDLIESNTWRNEQPGQEERFEPARFLEWLQIWQDMSPAFLAEKLRTLGSDTLALALDRYAVVVDLEEVGVSDHVDTFYPYGVMPREDENWELILSLLGDIGNEDPDFLEEALAHCCMRRSLLVDKTYIAGNDTLEYSVDGRRDRHRRDMGFITPMDAASFLRDARTKALAQILLEVSYDPLTALHLAAMQHRVTRAQTRKRPDAAADSAEHPDAGAASETRELDALLEAHHIVQDASGIRLLTGAADTETLYLRRQMHALAESDPAALGQRQDELLYLANVLMEGASVQGDRLSEALALQAAWATCNLGLEYCVFEESWGSEEEVLNDFLRGQPGLIKAFRVGMHLMAQLPVCVWTLLEAELTSSRARRHLHQYPWVQEQATYAFTKVALSREMRGEGPNDLHTLLEALLFLVDNSVCHQLRVISDAFPCYPRSLETGAVPGIHVDRRWRFIETLADLQRLHSFTRELTGNLIRDRS